METAHYWFCEPDGSVSEQVSEEQLIEALRAGRLREDSPVCQVGGETWLPAWRFPRLSAALHRTAEAGSDVGAPLSMPPPPRPTAPAMGQLGAYPAVDAKNVNTPFGGRVRRGLLLAVLILVAAPKLESLFLGIVSAGPHQGTTQDGFLEVTVPSRWVTFPGQPEDQLSVMNEDREVFMTIDKVPRDRAAAAPSLEAVEARACREGFYNLKKLEVREPRPFATNGLTGVERQLLATFTDGPQLVRSIIVPYHHNYYRIRLYAPPAQERQRQDEFDSITRSLRPA